MRTLSIRQPWAWLIVNGHKDVENRDWTTAWRGPLLIHASKTLVQRNYREEADSVADEFGIEVPALEVIERGGIVGVARLVDCVVDHPSRWFTGEVGLVLADARPLPLHPCKGALGFFHTPAAAVGLVDQLEV